MTKIGMITVGQAPRSDVVPDMAAILGGDVQGDPEDEHL